MSGGFAEYKIGHPYLEMGKHAGFTSDSYLMNIKKLPLVLSLSKHTRCRLPNTAVLRPDQQLRVCFDKLSMGGVCLDGGSASPAPPTNYTG